MPKKESGSPLAPLVPILQGVAGLAVCGFAWSVFDPASFQSIAVPLAQKLLIHQSRANQGIWNQTVIWRDSVWAIEYHLSGQFTHAGDYQRFMEEEAYELCH